MGGSRLASDGFEQIEGHEINLQWYLLRNEAEKVVERKIGQVMHGIFNKIIYFEEFSTHQSVSRFYFRILLAQKIDTP